MVKKLNSLRVWLSEALEFTLGNPDSHGHLPPEIGPQPYTQKPNKRHFNF